jgi:hypothetical protein
MDEAENKKKTDWGKVNTTAIVGLFLGLIFIGLLTEKRGQLGDMMNRARSAVLGIANIQPTLTPIPTEEIPTPTDEISSYDQTQNNTQTDQNYQQQAQAPQTVNCDVTANVPDPNPVYQQLTPQQCVYAQQDAVALWNKDFGGQQHSPQIPAYQYQPVQLPQNYNVAPPPAIGAPPAIQAPQVQAPAQLPNIPAPKKTCYSTVVNPGSPDQVIIPCP